MLSRMKFMPRSLPRACKSSSRELCTLYGGMKEKYFRYLFEERPPFIKLFGPKVDSLSKNKVSMSLEFKEEFVGNLRMPCLHGGVAATLIDHCSGMCAWSTLSDPHSTVSTVDLRIDYLLPAPCEKLICDAEIVQKGNKLIRVDAVLWNSSRESKIAIGRSLFNVYTVEVDMGAQMEKILTEEELKWEV
mmetsp:Transcript_11723/g.17762  ORF Transcript_11723/g.17762 Transcript_11723/m.17762 type:complete len:189 (+) Transcript_11723:52-618(+)